jgi:hypothetical protein
MPRYNYDPDDFYEGDRVKIIVRSHCKSDEQPDLIFEGEVVEIEENGFWWHDEGSDKNEFTAFVEVESVMYKPAWWAQQFAVRNITAGCRVEIELEDGERFKCRITRIEEDGLNTRTSEGARWVHLSEAKEIKLVSTPLEKVQYIADFLAEEQYTQLEMLADDHETSIGTILQSFIHDLLATDKSGGSDEEDLAKAWFQRNCCGREFMRS